MIEKKRWLLITFHTTSEAMAMEQRCQEAGLAGRLIPVPRTITADCGLACGQSCPCGRSWRL